MGRLDGKVALISGGGLGQGRSHALLLAQEGADIVTFDVCGPVNPGLGFPLATADDLAETARLVEKTGRGVVAGRADVRHYAEVKAVVDQGLERFGHIDIVVASAGIVTYHPLTEIPEDEWDDVIDVNLKGVWNTTRAALPSMVAADRGGSVIITSSLAGIRPVADTGHYAASKFGVVGLMRTIAVEYGKHGIRCNTVHPGAVGGDKYWGGVADSSMGTRDTIGSAMFAKAVAENDMTKMLGVMMLLRDPDSPPGARTPVRHLEPVDISWAVLFLASDESRFITGVQLPVDAGLTAKP